MNVVDFHELFRDFLTPMGIGYLFVLPWDPSNPGGVANVVLNLYRQFERRGYFPTILVGRWQDTTFGATNVENYRLRYGRLRGPLANTWRGVLMYWLVLPWSLYRIYRVVREDGIECINPHYPGDSALSFVLMRKLGIFRGKVIVSFHGSDFNAVETAKGYSQTVWRFILFGVDGIVTCSHALRNRMLRTFPGLDARITVAHNGFDKEALERWRDLSLEPPPLLAGAEYILHVGAYEHKKGHDVLMRAFKNVSEVFPGIKLVIIGGLGPLWQDDQMLAGELGLADRVLFLSDLPHSEIGRYFKSAKLFVLPSRAEPFGIVLLEAGAFGLPVIATRVGGIPEILSSPALGLLVEPDDPDALAAAVVRIFREQEWASKMGDNLRRHVYANFSWDNAAHHYLALLSPVSKADP